MFDKRTVATKLTSLTNQGSLGKAKTSQWFARSPYLYLEYGKRFSKFSIN